jgi:CheY-specific phosphatase CheX
MNNQEMELYRAAAMTFEQLGFLFLTPEFEEERSSDDIQAAATVEFDGPLSGRLVVTANGELLQPLAANMLGVDEASDTEQRDALGEISNVVCGNVMPRIAQSVEAFRIQSPDVVLGGIPCDWSTASPSVKVSLPFEEGRADVMLYVSGDLGGYGPAQ